MAHSGVPGWNPDALKTQRGRAKLTQEALALRLGRSRASVANYENGHVTPPAHVLRALADVLKTSPEEFIDTEFLSLNVLRALAGLSQSQVVERLNSNLGLSNFQKIEQVRVRRLRRSDTEDLARVFSVPVQTIIAAHRIQVRQRDSTTAPPCSSPLPPGSSRTTRAESSTSPCVSC